MDFTTKKKKLRAFNEKQTDFECVPIEDLSILIQVLQNPSRHFKVWMEERFLHRMMVCDLAVIIAFPFNTRIVKRAWIHCFFF